MGFASKRGYDSFNTRFTAITSNLTIKNHPTQQRIVRNQDHLQDVLILLFVRPGFYYCINNHTPQISLQCTYQCF